MWPLLGHINFQANEQMVAGARQEPHGRCRDSIHMFPFEAYDIYFSLPRIWTGTPRNGFDCTSMIGRTGLTLRKRQPSLAANLIM